MISIRNSLSKDHGVSIKLEDIVLHQDEEGDCDQIIKLQTQLVS